MHDEAESAPTSDEEFALATRDLRLDARRILLGALAAFLLGFVLTAYEAKVELSPPESLHLRYLRRAADHPIRGILALWLIFWAMLPARSLPGRQSRV